MRRYVINLTKILGCEYIKNNIDLSCCLLRLSHESTKLSTILSAYNAANGPTQRPTHGSTEFSATMPAYLETVFSAESSPHESTKQPAIEQAHPSPVHHLFLHRVGASLPRTSWCGLRHCDRSRGPGGTGRGGDHHTWLRARPGWFYRCHSGSHSANNSFRVCGWGWEKWRLH